MTPAGAALLGLLVAAAHAGKLGVARDYIETRIMNRKKTVEQRLEQYGEAARARLAPHFKAAGVSYPPAKLFLLGLKGERRLEVYAAGKDGRLRYIRHYPVLAASGVLGPKLREGDNQVPEGLYRVEFLNPNSLYHLSLRVNYPNEFDRQQARKERRTGLGGDIMIHGNAVSIGCIAIGDEGIEDVFVAAAETGLSGVSVVISPVDARSRAMPATKSPAWLPGLYARIAAEVKKLPAPAR